jgi:hypothetical protein
MKTFFKYILHILKNNIKQSTKIIEQVFLLIPAKFKFLPLIEEKMINPQGMLSRGSGNTMQRMLSYLEKQQMAKACLNLNKILTNPETIHELVESSKIKTASAHVVEQSMKYINDANAGTTIMRTNLLASVTTHIHYPVEEVEKHITNAKISYMAAAHNTTTPVRVLGETKVINDFANKHNEHIEKIELTNDKVTITENVSNDNKNPDALVTYKTSEGVIQKPIDVKMSNLEDGYLKGHLREIPVYGKEIVAYPNTHKTTLPEFYNDMYKGLVRVITMSDIKKIRTLDDINQKLYEKKMHQLQEHLSSSQGSLDQLLIKHPQMEQTLMGINTIPGVIFSPTFINIHYIQDTALTPREMEFLEFMANKADHLTLSKESYMTNYLTQALKKYRELFDEKTYDKLKPLVKCYPWIKRGLGDVIPKDFYKS